MGILANGWYKLSRERWNDAVSGLSESESLPKSIAMIDLEMMANYEPSKSTLNGNTVNTGELLTSVSKLAERWHWSRGKVKRFLDEKNGQEIDRKTGRLWTWIKVLGHNGLRTSQKSKRTGKRTANEAHIKNYKKGMRSADASASQKNANMQAEAWDAIEDEGELTSEHL